jgi:hypothetical protein
LSFSLADGLVFNGFEILWSDFKQPSGLDGEDFAHVLFGSHDQLVVDDPFRITVEKSRAWMDVDLLIVSDGFVPFLRILSTSMIEEASCHGFSNGLVVFFTMFGFDLNWQLETIDDLSQLLFGIKCSLQ